MLYTKLSLRCYTFFNNFGVGNTYDMVKAATLLNSFSFIPSEMFENELDCGVFCDAFRSQSVSWISHHSQWSGTNEKTTIPIAKRVIVRSLETSAVEMMYTITRTSSSKPVQYRWLKA